MSKQLFVWTMSVLLPGASLAQGPQDYQCTQGNLTRRVEILYETAATLPCEVHYFKDTEAPGERQVLWRAQNEAGYCESKTEEFIAKLREMGWDCGHSMESAPEADAPAEAEEKPEETADE